jgi:hypothetical protein
VPEEVAILFGLSLGAGTLLTFTWMVMRFLERRRDAGVPLEDPATAHQLDEMRSRLESVEERLDFAERLLAQQRDRRAIEGGQ